MSLTGKGAIYTATGWLGAVAAAHAAALPCDKLAGQAFGKARILETQDVSGAVPIATAYGGSATIQGPACRVLGEGRPTPDSSIRFEVWLPAPGAWNGRYQGVGNGGNAGTPFYPTMANALAGGYAVSGHDTGHIGAMGDSSYAIGHPERVIDFGWRSLHEVALAAKAVIQAYYGRPADLSLYNGCSTGGRQGLALAQRFPADYDGIAAGAPANDWPGLNAFHADFLRFLLEDPGRWVSPAKLERVERAVREECGGVDGLLDDPASCRFDLSKLGCAGEAGPDCLTRAELDSLRRRYYKDVARAMGGPEAIPPFYRLFLGTGMGHCGGGYGPNAIGGAFGLPAPVRDADHDVMEALAAWIQKGRAPERIVATRYGEDGTIAAQRPWCAYPKVAVWDGVGDRKDAGSYSCKAR